MINLHLNGDIVRCPDIRAIKIRLAETRLKEGRCKYGIHEIKCPVWVNHCMARPEIKSLSYFGRCYLSGCDDCPLRKKRVETGLMQKSYRIDNTNYRKMASAAHDLVKTSKNKTLFLTLTFPKFKSKPNEKQINESFSKFIENLRSNYNCSGYVAVREYGSIGNRVHFHLLCSLPFTDFVTLNSAWCHSISDYCEFSKNAVRTTKETIFIRNPGKALRYVCKYFAKSKGQSSETRLIFMSNNLIKKPISVTYDVNTILKGYKGIYINQTSDYSTCFRITDPDEFMRFCNEFLYEEFNKAYNFPIFSNKIADFYSPGSG